MIALTTNVLGKRPKQQARLVVDHPPVDHPTAVDHPPVECLPEDHLPVDSHLQVKTHPILKLKSFSFFPIKLIHLTRIEIKNLFYVKRGVLFAVHVA